MAPTSVYGRKYKGFWINGDARMVHPYSPKSYPAGSICKQGRGSSIEEVARFELPSSTMEIQELAEWFGLELAMMVVDEF